MKVFLAVFFQVQLTLEQHGLELCKSMSLWIFFNKYVHYYMIWGWLNSQICNHGYRGLTVKLCADF